MLSDEEGYQEKKLTEVSELMQTLGYMIKLLCNVMIIVMYQGTSHGDLIVPGWLVP